MKVVDQQAITGIGMTYAAKPYEPGLGKGEYAKKFLEARGTYILVGITLQSNNENSDFPESPSPETNTPMYTPLLEGVTGGAGRFAGKRTRFLLILLLLLPAMNILFTGKSKMVTSAILHDWWKRYYAERSTPR
jgi:hypothetical protein